MWLNVKDHLLNLMKQLTSALNNHTSKKKKIASRKPEAKFK